MISYRKRFHKFCIESVRGDWRIKIKVNVRCIWYNITNAITNLRFDFEIDEAIATFCIHAFARQINVVELPYELIGSFCNAIIMTRMKHSERTFIQLRIQVIFYSYIDGFSSSYILKTN